MTIAQNLPLMKLLPSSIPITLFRLITYSANDVVLQAISDGNWLVKAI